MITKILGLFDVIASILLITTSFMPKIMLAIAAGYLIIKGTTFGFMGDYVSFVDGAIGLYFVLLYFGMSIHTVNIISFVFLLQKGLFSLV